MTTDQVLRWATENGLVISVGRDRAIIWRGEFGREVRADVLLSGFDSLDLAFTELRRRFEQAKEAK